MQNNFRLIKGKFLNNSFKSLIRSLKGTQFSMDLTNHSKRFCAETDHTKNGALRVGTHDGVFHCDEILACYLLKQLPKYSDAEIIRTRDEKILNACDVVVDVGGVYDPSCDRYDHHQREFNQTLSSLLPNKKFNIKLSSAGLVYTHFGHTIIASLLNWNKTDLKTDLIFDKVYETFIQEIDAIDNGVSICEGEPNYRIHTNLSSRVSHLVPHWNEISSDDILYERFKKGIELVGHEFKDRVNYYGRVWWPAREMLQKAIDKRFEVHKSGQILEFDEGTFPWKEHLFLLEKSSSIEPEIKFVIFKDVKGKWRVQAVPITSHSFELRVPLKEEWRGLRDEELSKASQIDGCIFVHSSGFIGGNDSREGVLQMAVKTLEASEHNSIQMSEQNN